MTARIFLFPQRRPAPVSTKLETIAASTCTEAQARADMVAHLDPIFRDALAPWTPQSEFNAEDVGQ